MNVASSVRMSLSLYIVALLTWFLFVAGLLYRMLNYFNELIKPVLLLYLCRFHHRYFGK